MMTIDWRRIAVLLGGLGMLVPACAVSGRAMSDKGRLAVVVDVEPPRPQTMSVEARTGFVWVRGYYENKAGSWRWVKGHWEPARAGYRYVDPRWERRRSRWHFVQGHWSKVDANVHHRPARRPGSRASDAVVRDHRVRDHRAPPSDTRQDTGEPPPPR